MTWPREIAGHVIDRETGPEYDGNEVFHCIECGRRFDESDSEQLELTPCEPPPIEEEMEPGR